MRSAILTLFCVWAVIKPTILVGQNNFHIGFVQNNNSRLNHIDAYYNDMLHSLEVKAIGVVELSDDDRDFKFLAENATVQIKTRNWFTYREVRVRGLRDGQLERTFYANGREMDWNEYGQSWLAAELPEIARKTGLGAAGRVQRLIAQRGVDAAINEIEFQENNYARQIFCESIMAHENLTSAQLQRTVIVTAKEISSSSRLGDLLTDATTKFPQDSTFTLTLMRAVREISSSSRQSETAITIARRRGLDRESAIEMARTIEDVSSSSAQKNALETLAELAPPHEEAFLAYLHAVRTVSSSSAQSEALLALTQRTLTRDAWIQLFKVTESVSSSSAQARVLSRSAEVCPNDDMIWFTFLETVGTVSSSSAQETALSAMLRRQGLSKSVLKRTLQCVDNSVSSSSVQRYIEGLVRDRLME